MASGFQFALLLCLASMLLTAEACCEEKPSCPVCPPGWTLLGHRCFIYHRRASTWYHAERHCLSLGGNLASVHSDKENEFLRDYMNRVSDGHRGTWVGATNALMESFWMWADGSKFDYQRWAPKQPKSKKGNCLEMDAKHNSWKNKKCTKRCPYLCSQDLPCAGETCDKH